MAGQVLLLMWLRTITHYQYRNGGSMGHAMHTLYLEGGIPRFYRGLFPALIQGPLCRFGDTAANAGILRLTAESRLPIWLRTAAASAAAALWRCLLTPVDTVKVVLQVEGARGWRLLRAKVAARGLGTLYDGAAGSAAASAAAHWPWFWVYNACNARLRPRASRAGQLGQQAAVGFAASLVSDCFANSFRVIKTTVQASAAPVSYLEALQGVLAAGGWAALLGRGLGTKLLSNAVQGLLFTVLWTLLQERWGGGTRKHTSSGSRGAPPAGPENDALGEAARALQAGGARGERARGADLETGGGDATKTEVKTE